MPDSYVFLVEEYQVRSLVDSSLLTKKWNVTALNGQPAKVSSNINLFRDAIFTQGKEVGFKKQE